MVGCANNQAPTIGPTQDQKHVHVGSKEHLLKMWQTPTCVRSSSKKPISENTIIPQDFQREGPKNGQPKVIKFKYVIMSTKRENYQFQRVITSRIIR
jgi:hypothetical protein